MLTLMLPMMMGLLPLNLLCPPEDENNPPVHKTGSIVILRGDPQLAWTVTAKGDDDDDDEEQPIPQGGPWLGIQFGPVPEAMAKHLKAEGGLIVLNVVKKSPADRAGLQQNDVLIALDGKSIKDSDVRNFMDRLKKYKAGDEVELRILRDGADKVVTVTLGSRPKDLGQPAYKYGQPGDLGGSRVETVRPRFFQFKDGKMIPPDEEGAKRFEQLLPRLKDKDGNWIFQGPMTGGTSVVIRQDENGESLEVRKDMDGKFTVKRTSPGGKSSTKTYDTEKAFRRDDPEAHKFFKDRAGNVSGGGAIWMQPGPNGTFQFRFEDVDERLKDAMKQLERLDKMFGDGGLKLGQGRQGYSFHKQADGSIRVTNRGGDDELVEVFKNAQELKRQRPDLYKRYAKLQKSADDDDDRPSNP